MTELERAIEILDQILKDTTVPRNIKTSCQTVMDRLKNQEEKQHIRIGAAISMLDDISQDQNLPFHIRSMVWEIASLLEVAAGKIK